jgi:hypothetical protein
VRLGSLVLASVLLGVPRALQGRAFGARRPVYVEVSPRSPGLLAFGEALERALVSVGWALAPCRTAAVTVVEVLHVASVRDALGRAVEAVTLAVTEGRRVRRILLHAGPDCRDAAARELLARLSPGDC